MEHYINMAELDSIGIVQILVLEMEEEMRSGTNQLMKEFIFLPNIIIITVILFYCEFVRNTTLQWPTATVFQLTVAGRRARWGIKHV